MRPLRIAILVALSAVTVTGRVLAYDLIIDTFDDFVNTGTQLTNFFDPTLLTASDTGLSGVIGGSRDLLVESTGDFPFLLFAGVLPSGVLDYMSLGTGRVRVTYTRGLAGIGAAIACAESIEVVYLNADDAAQGIETGATEVILTLTGGISVSVEQLVSQTAGVLSYPLSAFAGVDLQNLTSISLELDGRDSEDADLAIDSIYAVGCEPPLTPSPSLGPLPLTLSVLILVGLGLLGLRRRRAL